MIRRSAVFAAAGLGLLALACKPKEQAPLYLPQSVAYRDIVVSAEASGAVEPILTVDVKSRASGQILQMRVETGDVVHQGDTLVMVDRRDPTNTFNQAQADLEVARAQLATADAQKRRSDQMFQQQLISQQDKETADLQYANANAALVRAEVSVQNARDQLADCNVLAPSDGVIIAKNVDAGQVITSAVRDVSGGTALLKMADLAVVQVRTLVDETDIGKIQPGMSVTITVDAYPNRPFEGVVLKIEPQSTVNQNVTMFPVLVRIPNEEGLLRPGMNAEVQIHIAQRQNVLAIPNAALRTNRDVGSAAQVLGLNPDDVMRQLAHADSIAGPQRQLAQGDRASRSGSLGGTTPAAAQQPRAAPSARPSAQVPAAPAPGAMAQGSPTGSPQGGGSGAQGLRPPLPAGVTQEQWDAIRAKRRSGEALTPAESTISARVRENFQRMGGFGGQNGAPGGAGATQMPGGAPGAPQTAAAAPGGQPSWLPAGVTEEQARDIMSRGYSGGTLSASERATFTQLSARFRAMMNGGGANGQPRRRFGAGNNFQFGGSYVVFVLRNGQPAPVRIRTGVTDMDYSEVASGLTERDTVLLLPSASLLQSQQDMKDRFSRMGGGVPGMKQQTPSGPTTQARPAGPGR
jgi:HlyD family secretion protein